ncbi:glucosaminidase domain-containing protein [Photobacterium sp. MCCC 1A19761]|uniref:glucosaminidase domain-containing protein n=1 Tax=Photobacterium sp. MCCC 1A19761 TaxID=3115000 RepID=UPI00307CFDAB
MMVLAGLTACGEPPPTTPTTASEPLHAVYATKPDFRAITDVKQRKSAFFDYLRPAVVFENQRIEGERQFLLDIQQQMDAGQPLGSDVMAQVNDLSLAYMVTLDSDAVTQPWLNSMLKRVDVLPESLVLSQAANESGWGRSRFAVEGNNYFGQWCYREGCGLVPSGRTEGASHEVAVFASPHLSVKAYFMNVNRNPAYAELREIRALQRQAGQRVEGQRLAEGLHRYSERGHAYVDEIQSMIKHNNQYWRQG